MLRKIEKIYLETLAMLAPPLFRRITGHKYPSKPQPNNYNTPGISGIIRAANEGKTIARTIANYSALVDEFIIVINNSNREFLELCQELQKKPENKIKTIHAYECPVYPPGSYGHFLTNGSDARNLAALYNTAFRLGSYTHAMKIDCDCVPLKTQLAKIRPIILSGRGSHIYYLQGLNVRIVGARVLLNPMLPLTSPIDHFVFDRRKKWRFIKRAFYEALSCTRGGERLGISYIHLREIDNPNSNHNISLELPHQRQYYQKLGSAGGIEIDDLAEYKELPNAVRDEIRDIKNNILEDHKHLSIPSPDWRS